MDSKEFIIYRTKSRWHLIIPLVFFLFYFLLESSCSYADWDPDQQEDSTRQAILKKAKQRRMKWQLFPPVDSEKAAQYGIQSFKGNHFTLYTDLPKTVECSDIPQILDAALPEICHYFRLELSDLEKVNIDAFIIRNRKSFEALNVLRDAPDFDNGYSLKNRIFIIDQNNFYYNRFLLVHELIHSIMYEAFGELAPRWFSEGIAEYLGLYRWQDHTLQLHSLPSAELVTPGFERLTLLRGILRTKEPPTIAQIMNIVPEDYRSVKTYAWSWAFVLFLSNHPEYKTAFRKMPWFMMNNHPNHDFYKLYADRWKELQSDWYDFIHYFEVDYQFDQMVIDHKKGMKLVGIKNDRDIVATRGWQNTGFHLEQGKQYRIRAIGLCNLYDPRQMLPCPPDGITLRYFDGRPLGQLLGMIDSTQEENESAHGDTIDNHAIDNHTIDNQWTVDNVFTIGKALIFTPKRSGTLQLRLNLPGTLPLRNQGSFKIRIDEYPSQKEK